MKWFIAYTKQAIDSAEGQLNQTLFKAKLWDYLNQYSINSRQKLIINHLLDPNFEGYMNTSKYAKLAKCSTDTALRDIKFLKEINVFIQNEGKGRSTSYRLVESI